MLGLTLVELSVCLELWQCIEDSVEIAIAKSLSEYDCKKILLSSLAYFMFVYFLKSHQVPMEPHVQNGNWQFFSTFAIMFLRAMMS